MHQVSKPTKSMWAKMKDELRGSPALWIALALMTLATFTLKATEDNMGYAYRVARAAKFPVFSLVVSATFSSMLLKTSGIGSKIKEDNQS